MAKKFVDFEIIANVEATEDIKDGDILDIKDVYCLVDELPVFKMELNHFNDVFTAKIVKILDISEVYEIKNKIKE